MSNPVLIVGAGIGGLTTALYLHARGQDVQIYESVSEIKPLGVGINLLPHAIQVLSELDLLDALLETGIETQALGYYNKFGQQIWQEPRGRAAGLPYPQISIHRGALQMLLLQSVHERIGSKAVNTNCTVTQVTADGSDRQYANLNYRDIGGQERSVEGHAIIAADGIHSKVRAQFYPDEGMPIWNGAILWRGLTRTKAFLNGRSMFMAGHQDQKFVAYPVDQGAYETGESMTNWIAELRYPVTELAEREDWNRSGDFSVFAPAFDSWRFDWLDIAALIDAADSCYEFPMVDRDPVERWSFGCTTLLGDAAHPMYPIGSNGASQAILDARSVACALDDLAEDVPTALVRYEAERRPPTAAIVRANRGNGPERVMQLAEERAPDGFENIEDVVPLTEREAIAAQYKQVAGFSKEAIAAAEEQLSRRV
jgi:2-polyprenyl-6-methoxyphenol hydroxylase-like FAD-dependent oxidoreductase